MVDNGVEQAGGFLFSSRFSAHCFSCRFYISRGFEARKNARVNANGVLLFVNQVGLAALFELFGFNSPAFSDVGNGTAGLQVSSSGVCAVHFVEHSPIFAALDGVLKQVSAADAFDGVEQVEVDGA